MKLLVVIKDENGERCEADITRHAHLFLVRLAQFEGVTNRSREAAMPMLRWLWNVERQLDGDRRVRSG